jgi:6-pyruvoyltetrahydropterin/6-carboxytetrahydropterin synthase
MYTVALKREFVAWHFLVGGDWGPENHLHDHQYQVEVELAGARLNEHGYLVDIVELEALLEELVAYFKDRTLNGLPEFAGLNPSLENFACIFCRKLLNRLTAPNLSRVRVQIWENDTAWATYREEC